MEAAFVTNISFPKSLEEVAYFMEVRDRFDVEDITLNDYVEWTAPKDACIGEPAFFMHSKTSIDTIRRLKRELKKNGRPDGIHMDLEKALEQGERLYELYGGKIFATGTVCGNIIEDTIAREDGLHWRSVYYAPIDNVKVLSSPVDIVEFRDFITISRTGAITKLNEEQLNRLNSLIAQ